MSVGVEWGLHCCLNLAWVGPQHAVTASRLAAFHALPAAYLNKQLQALANDGIIVSTTGPRGGFRLGRPVEKIRVLDVVTAIEGREELFRCTEIRLQEPGVGPDVEYPAPCSVNQVMRRAELAWREVLSTETLADIKETVERNHPGVPDRVRRWLTGAGEVTAAGGSRSPRI